MRIVHVFHQVNVDWATAGRQPTYPGKLAWVAAVRVPCDKPGLAVRLTNHIDTPWWDNDEVIGAMGSRSSSVGDVLWDGESLIMLTGSSFEILRDMSLGFAQDVRYLAVTQFIEQVLLRYPARSDWPITGDKMAAVATALKDFTANYHTDARSDHWATLLSVFADMVDEVAEEIVQNIKE